MLYIYELVETIVLSTTHLLLCIARESLYEDEEFNQRQLAALVVSKVTLFSFSSNGMEFCSYIIFFLWE